MAKTVKAQKSSLVPENPPKKAKQDQIERVREGQAGTAGPADVAPATIVELEQVEESLAKFSENLEQESEINRTLKKLAKARDTFSALFHANPIPTTLNRTSDGMFLDVNQAYLDFFGLEREAVIGHNSKELGLVVPASERSRLLSKIQTEGKLAGIELNVQTSSGEIRTILTSSRTIQLDGEEVHVSAFIDITERIRAEELLRNMVDAAPDATVVIDDEGRIVLVNKQLERLFGFPREQLIGKTVRMLVPERFHEAHQQHRRDYFTDPEVRAMGYGLKLFGLKSNGTEFPVEVSLGPLNTPDGMRAIGSIRDITERVEAEKKIHDLATRLTEAEQRERHRISLVLHDDLQQRLFAVQAQLSILHDLFKNGDWESLQSAMADMHEWLADSIHITRELSVNISPIVLHGEGLVHAVQWLAAQMHKQYALTITVQAENLEHRFEEGLRIMLFQAIRELLFNVVKHSGVQEAVVTFECQEDLIRITVSDKGRGFDASSTLTDHKMGHGLMSARQRLALLGCDLQVYSEPGKGTRAVIDCAIARAAG